MVWLHSLRHEVSQRTIRGGTVSIGGAYLLKPICQRHCSDDNLNTTQTPKCTKDKYNAKIIK
jgi:hypothetical protein